ncbi:polysaccharide pyruvyl transferase family protein [Pseudaminobacter soli (ex Li et al. 2025)]|uniref:polysaccharide pyruvyl transferase family protein n=1 Tax=Pseudaminobacter soli (ex Li et al. 2025) TaxID=1295366 RepID=UPI00247657B5|nr:polysaccharide pyruvyl transferase family protein [Mesorhizobium soli]
MERDVLLPDLASAPRSEVAARRTRAAPSRIALFGLFGAGNLGNDGSLETMLGFLRRARPDAQLFCVCDQPEIVSRSMNIDTVPIRPLGPPSQSKFLRMLSKLRDAGHAWRHISKADLMIIPGTGILDDFGERPQGMPLKILTWCLAARLAGTKIAFVCIGAGPIRHRLNRWLMTWAAGLAHYRSYRDEMSRAFMESVGFDTTDDPIYPDIVFKLPVPAVSSSTSTDPGRLTVGVGVMTYRGWYGYAEGADQILDRYIEKLSEFVVHLLDDGYGVRLLTGELGDSTAVDALLARVRTARPQAAESIVAEPCCSLTHLMEQMSQTDIVVATRFHNIVCALKMGKPTISLGYARKNDVLMAEMGLGDYCQHVEQFSVPTLIEHFDTVVANRDALAQNVRQRVADYDRQLSRQEEFLLSEYL